MVIQNFPLPDLIWDLRCFVDLIRTEHPVSKLSAGGTWSSPKVLMDYPFQCVHRLREIIEHAIGKPRTLCGWANVLVPGDSVMQHHHRYSHFGGLNDMAGVFYLKTPGARIFFYPLRRSTFSIAPHPGLLLLFPAELEHSVEKYEGVGERVSLAFNIQTSRESAAISRT